MIRIHDNFLTPAECAYWIDQSPVYNKINPKGNEDWNLRRKDITNFPIVEKVKAFHKLNDNLDLNILEATTQLWADGTEALPHVHDELGGREHTQFNSIIYLNNNFQGGEFFTNEQVVLPVPGRLIVFDGSKEFHGIKPIIGNHRYTLIFWWLR